MSCRSCNGDDGPCAAHEPGNDGYSDNDRADAAEARETKFRDSQW